MDLSNPRDVMRWSLAAYRESKELFGTPNNLSFSRETFNKVFEEPLKDSEEEVLESLRLSRQEESFQHYDKEDPTSSIPYMSQLLDGKLYEHIWRVNTTGDHLESQVFNREVLRNHAEYTRFIHKETYNKLKGGQ